MLYTIQNNQLSIDIESIGAEIKAVRFNGQNRLHDSNPVYWNRSAPLLFPNIGAIKNNVASIKGNDYKMIKHGFLRDISATMIEKNQSSIIFKFISDNYTKKYYPYDFEILVSYVIVDNIMESQVKIINTGTETMYFNFGLHPAFKIPLEKSERFEDYYLYFNKTGTYDILAVNLADGTINFDQITKTMTNMNRLPLQYQDYQNDALVFNNIEFDEITLKSVKSSNGVSFKFPNFPMLGIWTPHNKKAPFICIEPWIGCADPTVHDNNFLNKPHLKEVLVNNQYEITYSWEFF